MFLLNAFACAHAPADGAGARAPDERVIEEFPIEGEPLDVLLAVDPGMVDTFVSELPSLLDRLAGWDARIGMVSTALGDQAAAGDKLPIGPNGWWTSDDELLVPASSSVPWTPPLGGLGASFLGLQDARRVAVVRVLVAQVVDDATPGTVMTEPEYVEWLDDLGVDARLDVLAPDSAERLDSAAAMLGGARFPLDAEPAVVLESLADSLPTRSFAFQIAGWPEPTSLEVTVETRTEVLDFDRTEWTWDEATNTVTFDDYIPSAPCTVLVTYEPRGLRG